MKYDARSLLDVLFSPDPVAIKSTQPDPVADAPNIRPNILDQLSDAERALFPADPEPPADHIRAVLAVRQAFNGTIIAVSSPSGAPDIGPDDLSDDWAAWYLERAAIREYCGNQSREHAEVEALRETVAAMRTDRE